MFGKSLKLFKLFGFTVKADLSWLLIVGLVVWSLAGGVFPGTYPDLRTGTYVIMALIAAVGLFASIVVHELCHSLAARRFGMSMKGITLFLFGGVAEMSDEPPNAKAEFFMAIAGPAASLAIGALLWGASVAGSLAGLPVPITAVLQWIGWINFILVGFNLIPGFPLDGGRVLRSILWHVRGNLREATHWASRVGAGFGLVLIGLGFLTLLLGNPIGGLWWILIGMFVRAAAKQSYQQVLIRQALSGEPVRRFMNTEPVTVRPDTTVQDLVENYIYKLHYKMYPVTTDGDLYGCVTTKQIKDIPREQWAQRTVGELVDGCSEANTIEPDADAVQALAQMRTQQISRLMVVSDGRLEGILVLKDLLEFLNLKLELEGAQQPSRPPGLPQGGLGH